MKLREQIVRRDLTENVWMAFDTLRNHKLRSALTLLGITVAVTTLIAVVAILMGVDRNIQEAIQGYGTNTAFFSHLPTGPRFGRLSKEERMRKPISYEEFLAVREACTACASATVSIFRQSIAWIRYQGEEIVGLDFRGATGDFFSVYANAVVKQGRPFTEAENQHRVEEVVIGEDVAKGLFGSLDPIGKEVNVNGHRFQVIGVFEKPKAGLGGPGENEDRRVVMPYWTFRKVYPQEKYHGMRIEAYPGQLSLAVEFWSDRITCSPVRKHLHSQRHDFLGVRRAGHRA